MYELVGVYEEVAQAKIGGPFESTFSDEVVAVFTSVELGEAYIDKARLAKPVREAFTTQRTYTNRSLLKGAYDAYIRKIITEHYPRNPML